MDQRTLVVVGYNGSKGSHMIRNTIVVSTLLLTNVARAEMPKGFLGALNKEIDRQAKATNKSSQKNHQSFIDGENTKFLAAVKGKVSASKFEGIEKELNHFQSASPEEINQQYLKAIKRTENKKLSDKNKELLDSLITASSGRLKKDFDMNASLASASRMKKNEKESATPLPMSEEIENDIAETSPQVTTVSRNTLSAEMNEVARSAEFVEQMDAPLLATDNDSLFEIVTKAYFRNYKKIVVKPIEGQGN